MSDPSPTGRGPVVRALSWIRRTATPFDIVSGVVILTAAVILFFRFSRGLGAVTNLDQRFPWGLWIGFDVITGVAFAGGAYVLTFLVYVLRLEKYRPIVRVTVLNGFLAYVFYAGALLLDLGRPWKIYNPIIGNAFGLGSVMFLVAWHFLLYMLAELIEFSPTVAEWLGWKRARRILGALTAGAVIFGITLSTLHQSGLGALFLMAKPKIHPLWYSEMIPLLFFVSSMFAGLSMVIFEGGISRRVFSDRIGRSLRQTHDGIVFGLSRIAGAAMFVYLVLEVLKLNRERLWSELGTSWGAWYALEHVGLVAVPMVLYLAGAARRSMGLVKTAAVLAMLGIIVNRLNVSIIAFKWYEPVRYLPSWMEWVVSAATILAEIWVFRWVVRRMPVFPAEPSGAESFGTARLTARGGAPAGA